MPNVKPHILIWMESVTGSRNSNQDSLERSISQSPISSCLTHEETVFIQFAIGLYFLFYTVGLNGAFIFVCLTILYYCHLESEDKMMHDYLKN